MDPKGGVTLSSLGPFLNSYNFLFNECLSSKEQGVIKRYLLMICDFGITPDLFRKCMGERCGCVEGYF